MTTRETEGWKLEDVSERVSKVKRRLKMDVCAKMWYNIGRP